MNLTHVLSIFCSTLVFTTSVYADAWNLPSALNDNNTTVTFEVDSTWHLVHGTTRGVSGKVWLESPKDFRSIRAELSLPVKSFDTDSESRDERLLEVMAAEQFPNVSFVANAAPNLCDPTTVTESSPCKADLLGTLTIRNVAKPVAIPVTVESKAGHYTIKGALSVQWADFGVEDPSILIAKLDPTVVVSFSLGL